MWKLIYCSEEIFIPVIGCNAPGHCLGYIPETLKVCRSQDCDLPCFRMWAGCLVWDVVPGFGAT